MEIAQIKAGLIEAISHSKDRELLQSIAILLQTHNEEREVYRLNHQQREAITKARGQIAKGEFIEDADAEKAIDEWLSE